MNWEFPYSRICCQVNLAGMRSSEHEYLFTSAAESSTTTTTAGLFTLQYYFFENRCPFVMNQKCEGVRTLHHWPNITQINISVSCPTKLRFVSAMNPAGNKQSVLEALHYKAEMTLIASFEGMLQHNTYHLHLIRASYRSFSYRHVPTGLWHWQGERCSRGTHCGTMHPNWPCELRNPLFNSDMGWSTGTEEPEHSGINGCMLACSNIQHMPISNSDIEQERGFCGLCSPSIQRTGNLHNAVWWNPLWTPRRLLACNQ